MINDPIYDLFGKEIKPGDKIIYSAADGRSAVIRRGVVKEVYWRERTSHITPARYEPRVVVDSERLHNPWNKDPYWQEQSRAVHLSFPERIVVVDRSAW